jgi:uncharacterized membrane protein
MKKWRDWVFSIVVGLLCVGLAFVPNMVTTAYGSLPRVRAKILSVDNSQLYPVGIAYSGAQTCAVKVLSGANKGEELSATNYMNTALDKDKLFETGDTAWAMLRTGADGKITVTLIDHYRFGTEALLFGLFALLLIAFGGSTGLGALVSLVASVMVTWKLLIPLLLHGVPPIWAALGLVVLLTGIIMILVAGFSRLAWVAAAGSFAGTLLTCGLSVLFGNMMKLDGGTLTYAVPLLSQSTMTFDLRELFFAMVFIANSGALMDLSMDISSACREITVHNPGITRRALLKSGFVVGRNVIGTMTTTLLLAYSGSYLSMMAYFAGQGTPPADLFNLKYVASEILITLVGSFGLVTVAPFTAIIASIAWGGISGEGTGALPNRPTDSK